MDPFLIGSDRGGDSAGVVEQTSGKVRVRRDRVNRVTKVLQHVTDVEVMGAVTLFNQPRQNESTGGGKTGGGGILQITGSVQKAVEDFTERGWPGAVRVVDSPGEKRE